MGFRRFRDRSGGVWEVVVRSRSDWEFTPVGDNKGPARVGAAPGYETDPFELSIEVLQRLLDGAQQTRDRNKPSPFKD